MAKKPAKAKRNWTKIESKKKYIKYADCEEDEILVQEGKYIGRAPVSKFGKQNFDFKEQDGTVVSLNPAGHLAYQMDSNVEKGDVCRIVYLGMETAESGKFAGKDSHQFELMVDSSEREEADDEELESVLDDESEEDEDEEDEDETEEDEEEDSEDEEDEESEDLEDEEDDEEEEPAPKLKDKKAKKEAEKATAKKPPKAAPVATSKKPASRFDKASAKADPKLKSKKKSKKADNDYDLDDLE